MQWFWTKKETDAEERLKLELQEAWGKKFPAHPKSFQGIEILPAQAGKECQVEVTTLPSFSRSNLHLTEGEDYTMGAHPQYSMFRTFTFRESVLRKLLDLPAAQKTR